MIFISIRSIKNLVSNQYKKHFFSNKKNEKNFFLWIFSYIFSPFKDTSFIELIKRFIYIFYIFYF